MTGLNGLFLRGNKLSGPIPTNLKNLTGLSTNYGLDLYYDALYTSDPALKSFIDERNSGWDTTQTVAPTDVRVLAQRERAITLDGRRSRSATVRVDT